MRAENRALLGPADVVLAAHPGSGASWIGTLLVHLGIFYASGEDEQLEDARSQRTRAWLDAEQHRPAGEARAAPDSAPPRSFTAEQQQARLPALRDRDRLNPVYREACRVIKTNQAAMGWSPPGRVLLVVRDGRDALLSLHQHLRDFSGLQADLHEYLEGGGGRWLAPPMSWAIACLSWLNALPQGRLHVLQFEACRAEPLAEFGALLAFLGIERSQAELEHAIAESSYARMRELEGAALEQHGERLGRGRIMRAGKVGGWREVYDARALASFAGLPRRALERFGYPTDGISG